MKTAIRLLLIALLFAACIGSESLGADFSGPVDDGWHTWQVAAADGGELQIFASVMSGKPVQLRLREEALFWLVQSDSDEAFAVLDRLLSENN